MKIICLPMRPVNSLSLSPSRVKTIDEVENLRYRVKIVTHASLPETCCLLIKVSGLLIAVHRVSKVLASFVAAEFGSFFFPKGSRAGRDACSKKGKLFLVVPLLVDAALPPLTLELSCTLDITSGGAAAIAGGFCD